MDISSVDVAVSTAGMHVILAARREHGMPLNVYYLKSIDFGRTWSAPVQVNKPGMSVTAHRGNDAQLAVSDTTITAVWQQRSELPGSGAMTLAYSNDGGLHWRAATPPKLDDPTHTQSYFDLAADRSGRFHLVWLDDREENGNSQGLRYAQSRNGGFRWKAMGTVDDAVCTCCWTRLNVLGNGQVSILYRDDTPHDMNLAILSPNGGGSNVKHPVGRFDWQFQGCPHCGGGLAETRESDGSHLHGVVWTGMENAEGIYYLNSPDEGRSWSAPVRLTDGKSREPDIAALADGTLGIAYVTPGSGGGEIAFVRSGDGGKHWSKPMMLSTADHSADHPRILSTPRGFRLFWTERAGGKSRVLAMAEPPTHH
jgi:hypothetical protein